MPQPRRKPDRRRQPGSRPVQGGGSPRLLARTVPVQIAAAAGDNPERRFRLACYTGEPMNIWPFELPVIIDLASADLSAQQVPVLYDHCKWDPAYIVGQGQSVAIEGGILIVEGKFVVVDDVPPERNYARQVLARADAGYQWQASVGADPTKLDKIEAGASVNVNGRDYPGPCYVARGIQLREVSFVILGGDRKTSAVVARNRIKGTAMSFEEWLLSMGFEDAASLSEVQRANLKLLYDQENPEGEGSGEGEGTSTETPTNAAEGDPPAEEEETTPANAAARRPRVTAAAQADRIAARRRAEAAETQRTDDIRRICAEAGNPTMTVDRRAGVSIAAHAIQEGWSVAETRREVELQQLRASRGQGPAVIVAGKDRDCTLQALQGAMILRAAGRLDSPAYGTPQAINRIPGWLRAGLNDADRNRYMEAAHRYADISMVDLCREALRLDGREATGGRSEVIQAAFSGGTLANIFTTNVNALLLDRYMLAGDTTRGWTREIDVADFKTQERPRVQVGNGLKKLPRGGTADHASYADVAESYKIARYAKQFVIDEQDMLDDSLGALADTPADFGMNAAQLRPDLVYAIILANDNLAATSRALFNSTDGNLDTSAALASATLKAAISAMRLFQENGRNLDLSPSHLIVPGSLEFTALELMQSSQIVIAGTAGSVTERGDKNTLQSRLQVVVSAELENGVTDPDTETAQSGSATTWYLASNKAPTIEVAYRRGTGRAPQVRTFMLDKGQWGIGWDVAMDIGAKALDWRGLHKATA